MRWWGDKEMRWPWISKNKKSLTFTRLNPQQQSSKCPFSHLRRIIWQAKQKPLPCISHDLNKPVRSEDLSCSRPPLALNDTHQDRLRTIATQNRPLLSNSSSSFFWVKITLASWYSGKQNLRLYKLSACSIDQLMNLWCPSVCMWSSSENTNLLTKDSKACMQYSRSSSSSMLQNFTTNGMIFSKYSPVEDTDSTVNMHPSTMYVSPNLESNSWRVELNIKES